ncbi:MAG: AAA family ATPase [Micropepsaceae bacterium]
MQDDPFAPLDGTRAATPSPEPEGGQYLAPLPKGMRSVSTTHPQLGDAKHIYSYTNSEGFVMFHVIRFEDPKERKTYRPASVWMGAGGKPEWRWLAPPGPRPLFNLYELAKRPRAQVLLVEGEKAAIAARRFMQAWVVVTSFGGAKGAGRAEWFHMRNRKVTIWPDADEAGAAYAREAAEHIYRAGAASVRVVKLDRRFKDGWDLGDWGDMTMTQPVTDVRVLHRMVDEAPLVEGGSDPGSAGLRPALADAPPRAGKDAGAPRVSAPTESLAPCDIDGISGAALQDKVFAPIKWIAPDYIVEGLTMIAGKPKLGKSWLALNLAFAVAAGGRAFSSAGCEQGDVLALALEDNQRRLKSRLQQMAGDAKWPARLHFHTDWPRLDEGGLSKIEAWIASVPNPKLIVVDVWAKVRGRADGKKSMYADDFESLAVLQRVASQRRLGIVVMHHASKRDNPDDPFDLVSGTTGLTGAADSVLILRKEAGQADAVLYGRGRDLPVFEKALRFDGTRGLWAVLGDAEAYRATTLEGRILKELERAEAPLRARDVVDLLGDAKVNSVKVALSRMARQGKVSASGDGYAARQGC